MLLDLAPISWHLQQYSPKNLTNRLDIDISHALSAYNKKEYHHFYPRAYLKGIGKSEKSNVLANIVMITSAANKSISDNSPSLYVPALIEQLGDNCDKVFRSNLLPLPSQFDYESEQYERFLAERGNVLSNFIESELVS